jgi:hypothetical protein
MQEFHPFTYARPARLSQSCFTSFLHGRFLGSIIRTGILLTWLPPFAFLAFAEIQFFSPRAPITAVAALEESAFPWIVCTILFIFSQYNIPGRYKLLNESIFAHIIEWTVRATVSIVQVVATTHKLSEFFYSANNPHLAPSFIASRISFSTFMISFS